MAQNDFFSFEFLFLFLFLYVSFIYLEKQDGVPISLPY